MRSGLTADCRDVVGLMMQNLESFRVADWRDVVGCRLEYFRQRDVVPTLFAPVQVAETPGENNNLNKEL